MDRYRVVIADDQEDIVQGLASLFSLEGDFDVVSTVTDGAQAVSAARSHRPDVVLMDYRMKTMDGIEAAARIRAENPETQVVILSVYDREPVDGMARHAGVADWVSKSEPSDRILDAVRRAARASKGYSAHGSTGGTHEA